MTDIVDQLIAEKQKETDTAKLLGWAAEVIQQLRLERDQAVRENDKLRENKYGKYEDDELLQLLTEKLSFFMDTHGHSVKYVTPEVGEAAALRIKNLMDEVETLRHEKDQAVKESNRRDQKWKDGIEQVCGCKIDFCGFGGSHLRPGPPTFENFIHSLKHKAELADKVIELLKKFRPYLEYK